MSASAVVLTCAKSGIARHQIARLWVYRYDRFNRRKEGNPNASAYSASKAGVIALTKSAGKECAKLDMAVNCSIPVAAKTRIFD
jgi:NAD(P)-dependent dehydrogenase (short-subunit alcohol dehydrogenase family)